MYLWLTVKFALDWKYNNNAHDYTPKVNINCHSESMLHALLYFQVKQEKYRLELSLNYQEIIEV